MDRGVPNWQPVKPDAGAKMIYHLGRAMHLAGRCVECGACENVCASGVDVRYLIEAATDFVEEEYGFRAGMDAQTPSALLTFKPDDPETGFWGVKHD
jgi:Fe-S oxidoreductase